MTPTSRCPGPDELADYFAGALSEESWRRTVRHLADCAPCRRHVSLLAMADAARLPAATIAPPLPSSRRAPSRTFALRFAAAAGVLGAFAWALLEMSRPAAAPKPVSVAAPAPRPEERPVPPPPPRPPAPRPAPPEPERPPSDPSAPPVTLPPAVPPPEPAAPSPPPAVPAETRIAERSPRGTIEAVEIAAGAGSVAVVSDGASSPLSRKRMVSPSDTLRAASAASFALPDGTSVHLPEGSEVAVSWSQTHLCPALDVRHGSALVELGAEPRPFHVSGGALGVRLREASGPLLVTREAHTLRATPLGGTARLRGPGGHERLLGARETLVVQEAADAIEPFAGLELALAFPTTQEAMAKPAEAAAGRPAGVPADPRELAAALGRESYRFRVSGRQLREGAWVPSGLFISTIDEFTAVRRAQDPTAAHLRRQNRDWDNVGVVTRGSRAERILDVLRTAQAPHVQLAVAAAAAGGAPRAETSQIGDRLCSIVEYAFEPARIRGEVSTLMQQAVAEGRLEPPESIAWDTLEGTLELAVSRSDGRLLRAVDRRRVAYTVKARTLHRKGYHLETVYEFSEHGQAALKLPAEMIRKLEK